MSNDDLWEGSELKKAREILLWLLVCGAMLVTSVDGYRRTRLRTTRKLREAFLMKALDSRVPIEVANVIRDEGTFTVAQIGALIETESRGNPLAVSPNGRHRGLMMVGVSHCKTYGVSEEDLFDPIVNVTIGVDILAKKAKQYPKEYHHISAYNCRTATFKAFLEKGAPLPTETQVHWRRYRILRRRYDAWVERGIWTDEKDPW